MKAGVFSVLFLFAFLFNSTAQSETGPCNLTISLLTCTPGEELYSSFGHSAFRVQDYSTGTDLVYNYGTFDFNDPAFYSKFVKGKLLYFVSPEYFQNFMYQYAYEGRGVTEQVLNLNCAQKQELLQALQENIKEENKFYLYDFLYDNCSTRLWDMLNNHTSSTYTLKEILPSNDISFRNLLHEYLNEGGQYWSKLGIDILLGLPVDKKITGKEAMFLPDYLMASIDSTTINGQPLTDSKKILLPQQFQPTKNSFTGPQVIFTLLWLIIVLLSTNRKTSQSKFLKVFDFLFFLITGLTGILLIFMWAGTNHAVCANNFNLLWAMPINVIIAFLVRNYVIHKKTFMYITIWYLLVLLVWFFLPQQLNPALIPVAATAFIRSFSRSYFVN